MRITTRFLALLLAAQVGLGAGCAGRQPAPDPARNPVTPAELDPAALPLVEIVPPGEEGRSLLGIVIAPSQVLFSPGGGGRARWMPGSDVRCIRSGEQATIQRIVNWGGAGEIQWAVLEARWPQGAEPAPVVIAPGGALDGDMLTIVSWREGAYTIFSGAAERTNCQNCAHHIPFTAGEAPLRDLRLGAATVTEQGWLAGLLYDRGWGVRLPSFRARHYLGYIPANRCAVESVEPVTEARFAEILRDQKAARDAATAAVRATRLQQWDEALAAAQEAVSLDPNLGRAWLALGYAARGLGRDAVAATALRNALRRGENPPWTAGQLASALANLRRDDEATELALRIEREWPDDTTALSGAAYALLRARRDDEARRVLNHLLELDPDDDWAGAALSHLEDGRRRDY